MSITSTSSTSSTPEIYPYNSSDTQWPSCSSHQIPQIEMQPFVGETQQYRLDQPNCSGGIYNIPKVNYTNIDGGVGASNGINGGNYVGVTGINNNVNGHMQCQLQNFPSTSNGNNNHDIRFQGHHHSHAGVVVSAPPAYSNPPGPSTSWASSGNYQRLNIRPSWSGNKAFSGGVKKPKRIRTAFTSQQMMELENEYGKLRYLDRGHRIELSKKLNLNERTVKVWFQNRRMKEKKDKIETAAEAEATSTTEPTLAAVPPVIMYDSYPHNGLVSREVYVEQYPGCSAAMPLLPQNNIVVPFVQSGQDATFNQYPTFTVDNNVQLADQLDMQYREVNNGLAECHISHKDDQSKVEITNSTLQPGTSNTSDASTNDFNGENWDLSWIRSINLDNDF